MPTSQENVGRSGVYRLLGRLWLREVDSLLLNQLSRGDLGAAFATAGGVVPALVTGETVEDLEVDFCQLFLGPSRHCPPYQSVWETGQFEGEAGKSVLGFAEVVRYEPSAVLSGGMLDHLGVQLDLMGHLLGGGIEGETQVIEEVANAFYSAHLTWPEPLLSAAQERARTAFYRSMLKLTGEFLETESRS
ncbi:MAG: molecular chaperone TorD family protein [Planctomycetota bacterium]|nr:molecular chaperone TorD family protein [Planctomycetota bacterium]